MPAPRTLSWRMGVTLRRTATALTLASALAAAALTSAGAASAQSAAPAHDWASACAAAPAPDQAACLALVRTSVGHRPQAVFGPGAAPVGVGYGPSSLQSAYKVPSSTAGSGETVAVVDAYDDPVAQTDLNAYRSAWGLPGCAAGCFTKVNENGKASPLPRAARGTGWDVEESLDIEMVSAICPNCHILLVETNTADFADLGTGVNAAVRLGAVAISNSYGSPEAAKDTTFDSKYYNHRGVAIVAAAGDSGYGVGYPASSRYVTSAGGTSLVQASNSRGWQETVWTGTGSGCSSIEAKPSWQTDTGCSRRTDNDVAAVSDPDTGVAVYDTYSGSGFGGWGQVGGTSAASPIIASVFALAGKPVAGTYPSSYIYQHTSALFDVTSGFNGFCSPAYLCTAGAGYDGPTGWGTPDGTAAFTSG